MWPKLLDMEADECRRVLRRLELEAYASLVSAFRAQGDLTPDKKGLLKSVATNLSITTERHKAEVRRAVNDEELTTIAERTGEENSSMEWSVEGRRLVPLMPRFIPQTRFTVTANQVANMAYAHNATLPDPEATAKKEGSGPPGEAGQLAGPPTDPSYIVLPPGTVLPRSSPDLQTLEEQNKPRHPSSSSYASNPASFLNALASSKLSSASSSSSAVPGSKVGGRSAGGGPTTSSSSMKITYTKVVGGTTPTPSQGGQKQVIIMSSANTTTTSTEVTQRSHGPGSSKVTMTTMSAGHPRFSGHPMSIEDPLPRTTHYHPAYKHHHRSKGGGSKHRGSSKHAAAAAVVQQQTVVPPAPSAAPSSVYGSSAACTVSGSVIPTMIGSAGKRPAMPPQRPEPGMKLITQTVASSTGKMTSKTYQVSAPSPSPSVRTTTIGMQAPRTSVTTGSLSPVGVGGGGGGGGVGGGRNIVTTAGPRIVTLPSSTVATRTPPSTSNVITLSPMALQKAAGKSASTTVVVTKPGSVVPGKTNVIVVQKSQFKSKMISSPRVTTPGIMAHSTSILTRPKIAMTMTSGAGVPVPGAPGSPGGGMSLQSVRFPTPPPSLHQKGVRGTSPVSVGLGGTVIGAGAMRGRSPTSPFGVGSVTGAKTQGMVSPKSPIAQTMATIAADLELQGKAKGHRRSSAVSPPGQGGSKVVVEEVPGGIMRSTSLGREPSLLFHPGSKPNSEWIEYDGSPPSNQSASSAIKALLEFRGHPPHSSSAVKHVPMIPGVASSGSMMPAGKQPAAAVSAAARHIHHPGLSQAEPQREPSSAPTTAGVRGGGGSGTAAERLEFSPDQLSSVVDQFEQFLESEKMGTERRAPSQSELVKRLTSPRVKPADPTENPSSSSASRMDPFDFVEEIISKDSEVESSMSTVTSTTTSIRPGFVQETIVPAIIDRGADIAQRQSAQQPTTMVPQVSQPAVGVANVVMESSTTFDITQMNLEDLSCRRMREEEDEEEDGDGEDEEKRDDEPGSATEMMSFFDTSSGGSGSEGVTGPDGSLRVSRRKRKAPTPIDEETGPSSMPSWARAAWNLLQRVMRFRGANRPKGGINAASWFTRPVDPSEAPGYHKVIKKPMDFGTIKRNLEAASYQDFGEFHHDMMLVRNNCLQYNPPGHAARRDCEEVFQFYTSEYSKTLDRWQKQLLMPPKSPKRLKTDMPPALPQPQLQTQTQTQPQPPPQPSPQPHPQP